MEAQDELLVLLEKERALKSEIAAAVGALCNSSTEETVEVNSALLMALAPLQSVVSPCGGADIGSSLAMKGGSKNRHKPTKEKSKAGGIPKRRKKWTMIKKDRKKSSGTTSAEVTPERTASSAEVAVPTAELLEIVSRFNIHSPELIRVLSESPDFVVPKQLDRLPPTKVAPLTTNRALSTIQAPGESSGKDMSFGSFACARVVSNYPLQAGRPYREGDPICDRLSVHLYENRVVAALADGCNWGSLPRKAAKRACKAYSEFVRENHRAVTSVKAAGTVICAALAAAHSAIQAGATELGPDPGTTTICAGLLLEIDYDIGVTYGSDVSSAAAAAALASDWDGSPFVWVYASLGDCKCFHYACQTRAVTDLTEGNRNGLLDPTDPGGRIGGRGAARMGNFMVGHKPCEEGDLLMIMSDGVHDNLDPVQRGKQPSYFKEECDEWAAVGPLRTARLQTQYMEDFILRKIIGDVEEPSCQLLTNGLIDNSIETTQKSRDFLESHPKDKLEVNYAKFPGKLDHSSCLTFKASKVTLSYADWMGTTAAASSTKDRASMEAALQERERQLTWRTDAIVRSPRRDDRSFNPTKVSSDATEITDLDFGDLDASDVFADEEIVEAVKNLRRITLGKDQLLPFAS